MLKTLNLTLMRDSKRTNKSPPNSIIKTENNIC